MSQIQTMDYDSSGNEDFREPECTENSWSNGLGHEIIKLWKYEIITN